MTETHAATGTSPGPQASGGALAVFKIRPFLFLWLAQAFTQIGGNMVIFGLTIIIAGSTNSTAAVSALILTFLVPAVLFSAVAGVFVDRLDKRLVLIGRTSCEARRSSACGSPATTSPGFTPSTSSPRP